jgi:chromosome segregation ATPase
VPQPTSTREAIASLTATVNSFMEYQKERDRAAEASRNELHAKLTGIQVAQGGILRDIAYTREEVAQIKEQVVIIDAIARPVPQAVKDLETVKAEVEILKTRRHQAEGVHWALSVLRIAIVAFVSTVSAIVTLLASSYLGTRAPTH